LTFCAAPCYDDGTVIEWLTIEEVCVYLKVNRRTLYRLMETGKLPYYQIADGGRRRIRKEDVDALLVPGVGATQKTAQGEP